MDRGQVFAIIAAFLSILNTVNYVEGQNTVLTWRVVDEGNIKSFYFSPDNMQEFLDCVCGENTLWCGLYYIDNRGTYITGRGDVTQSDTGSDVVYSNKYNCRSTSRLAAYVRCERLNTTACSNIPTCWSYQFSDFQGSCQQGEVGFTWASDQNFTQNVHNKVTITSPCSRSCPTQTTAGWTTTTSTSTSRSSTTTTVDSTTTSRPTSTTTVTTTTTPVTVKPVTITTTTSSSTLASTSASTTGGGGNAPQKDDSSDDTGVIVGVVIAVLVVTAALIVGGIFWWRRRKNAEKSDRSLGNNVTVVQTSAFGITNHAFNRYEEGGTPDLLYAQVPADDPIGSRQNSAQYSNVQIKPMPNGKGPNHSYENVQRPVQPSSENNNHDNSNGVTPTPENPDEDQYLYPTNTEQSRSPPRFVITPKTDAQSDGMEYEDVSRFAEPDPGTAHTNIPSSATNNSNNNDNFYEIPIVPPNITNSASNPPNNLKSTNNSTAKPKSQNVYSKVDEIATSNSVDDIIPPQRTRFNVVPTSSTSEPANDVYELAQAIDTTDSLASTGKPQVAPKVARKPKGRKKKEDDKNNHVYFELESAASIRLDGPYSVEDKDEDDDDDEERYTENPYEDPDKQQSNDSQYSVI